MLFTKRLTLSRNIMRPFSTTKLPKDWAATAERELKGAPLEELTWHTAEVG